MLFVGIRTRIYHRAVKSASDMVSLYLWNKVNNESSELRKESSAEPFPQLQTWGASSDAQGNYIPPFRAGQEFATDGPCR